MYGKAGMCILHGGNLEEGACWLPPPPSALHIPPPHRPAPLLLPGPQALNPASVPVNYASASSNDLTAAHNSAGGLTLDLSAAGGGGSVGGEAPVKSNAMMRAHGALMLVAFAGLMPLGVLLARHKWAFGRKEVRGCL